ncbi:hypothetical protein XaC1_151 [Xanthomonas phage XaC1]|nr:hypothetical protein XaC1_151 [Xanthomonas phage XaC1]
MLLRDKVQSKSTELSGTEFSEKVLEQISSTVLNLNNRTESSEVLDDLSDVLELLNCYMSTQNIKPSIVLEHASSLRNELGSYSKKRLRVEGE